jgi:mannose-1-phosphate guanylyltransferase
VKAVVLVGGEGTRLRPLTLSTPKQMLPVAGRTVIERVLEHLARHGIDEVVLSLGYKPDAFLEAFPEGRCAGVRLKYAVESSPLDTAGAIRFAADQGGVGDETFLVVNGDVLTEIDISDLVRFHRDREAEATIALTPVEDPSRFGVVPVDANGKVEAFIEKPPASQAPTNMINAGIYVLEPSFLERVPPGKKVSVEREVFPAVVRDGRLYALGSDALWTDMGTPEKYLEANLAWAKREGALSERPEGAHPLASVANSVVCADARIEEGARVHEAVVLQGARVRSGATVRRSVLGRNVEVGLGAVVDALSVLGDGWHVAAGEILSGARLPVG